MLQRPMKLVFELSAPDGFSAGAVAQRVARLNHETLDHAMEDDAVVVPILRMSGEIFDRARALQQMQSAGDLSTTVASRFKVPTRHNSAGCKSTSGSALTESWEMEPFAFDSPHLGTA